MIIRPYKRPAAFLLVRPQGLCHNKPDESRLPARPACARKCDIEMCHP